MGCNPNDTSNETVVPVALLQGQYRELMDGACMGRILGVTHSDRLILKRIASLLQQGNLVGRVTAPTFGRRGFDGEHYAPSDIRIVSMVQARPVVDRFVRWGN